jgi:hypothetical protein
MDKELNVRVKLKRDTSSNWTVNNPIPMNGEMILVDTAAGDLRVKIGDGETAYTGLPFIDEKIYSSINDKQDREFIINARLIPKDLENYEDFNNWTLDNVSATYEQIQNAYDSGKNIKLKLTMYGRDGICIEQSLSHTLSGRFTFIFPIGVFLYQDIDVDICIGFTEFEYYVELIYRYSADATLREFEKKEDKSMFSVFSNDECDFIFTDTNNMVCRCSAEEMKSINFIFNNIQYPENYTSELSFNSGSIPTVISYADSGILNWLGTDCSIIDDYSVFDPTANKHYDIVFYFNGTCLVGLVNGFEMATVNNNGV